MLSTNSSTSRPLPEASFSSRKYSAIVRPVSATRRRLPGGSFIWPYTIATFTSTLTDAGEHGQARVRLRDVVDEFHHVHGLADAGAAEQADLAALRERAQ